MTSNNSKRDGGPLEKSWPKLSRPLTLSDITGPSVPNLLESIDHTESEPHVGCLTGTARYSDEAIATKGHSKEEVQYSPDLSVAPRQFDTRMEDADIVKSKPFKDKVETPLKSPKLPDGVKKPPQFQSLPSALIDHDFGFSSGLTGPSLTDKPFTDNYSGRNDEKSMPSKEEINENEKDISIGTAYYKNSADEKPLHNFANKETAGSEMETDGNYVNIEDEVYCICRTSDTDRFMM